MHGSNNTISDCVLSRQPLWWLYDVHTAVQTCAQTAVNSKPCHAGASCSDASAHHTQTLHRKHARAHMCTQKQAHHSLAASAEVLGVPQRVIKGDQAQGHIHSHQHPVHIPLIDGYEQPVEVKQRVLRASKALRFGPRGHAFVINGELFARAWAQQAKEAGVEVKVVKGAPAAAASSVHQ